MTRGPGSGAWLLAWLLVALVAFFSIRQQNPPAPLAVNAPVTEFAAGRAMKHVEAIAQAPRPIGSARQAEAREYILHQLTVLGLPAEIQKTTAVDSTSPPFFAAGTVHNIVARKSGTGGSGSSVLLVAHYDSVPTGPGANDDGAGVAALLETARALQAGNSTLKNDVLFLFTDGEEAGLLGARAFINEHPWAGNVRLTLNFEARGRGGAVIMFETSAQNGGLIRALANAAPYPVATSLGYEVYKRLPNDTDLTVFKKAKLQGLNFAYIDGLTHYHSELDSVGNVDARSLQHHGSYALALARSFGNAALAEKREDDAVYFNAWGPLLVHYPERLALPLGLAVLVLFAAVAVLGFKRKRVTLGGFVKSALLFFLSLISTPALITGTWWLIRKVHPHYNLIPGDTYSRDLYALGFVALTIATTSVFLGSLGRSISLLNLILGALLWWAVSMVAASILLVGGSYVFTWPLLVALLALGYIFAAEKSEPGPKITLVLFTLYAVPGILLIAPLLYFTFMALPLAFAGALVVLLVLLLGLLIPHLRGVTSGKKWMFPGTIATLGVVLFFVAGLTSSFGKDRRRVSHLLYALNAGTEQAVWASAGSQPDEWTAQFLGTNAQQRPLADYFPLSRRLYLQATAPTAPLAAPEVSVLQDTTENGGRRLRLRIASPREAVRLSVQTEAAVLAASVDGKQLSIASDAETEKRWGMLYFALPKEGIELSLETKTAGPLTLTVVDESYGLPEIPGRSFTSRLEYMMPAPLLRSDCTLVGKNYTF